MTADDRSAAARDRPLAADDGASGEERPLAPDTLSRNWNELLQEIRVTQTGVQILTGFLLTVPFSSRFESLTTGQRTTYLLVLCGCVLATGFFLAPVAFHRTLFRHRRRQLLVASADRFAKAGLVALALTSSGALALVVDLVAGTAPAIATLVVTLAFFVLLWLVAPRWLDRRDDTPRTPPPDDAA